MTHFLKAKKDKFDSVVEGMNFQIIQVKMLPKAGDKLVFEHATKDAVEQKETTVIDVSGGEGLMKGWYFVQHEMKGGGK